MVLAHRPAWPVVPPGQVGKRGCHLVEEITPGELPAEFFAARPVQGADRQFQRGNTAEPQVGAEPGGLITGQVVVVLAVAGEVMLAPEFKALASSLLAALGQVPGRAGSLGRELAVVPDLGHIDRGRRGAALSPGRRAPGT